MSSWSCIDNINSVVSINNESNGNDSDYGIQSIQSSMNNDFNDYNESYKNNNNNNNFDIKSINDDEFNSNNIGNDNESFINIESKNDNYCDSINRYSMISKPTYKSIYENSAKSLTAKWNEINNNDNISTGNTVRDNYSFDDPTFKSKTQIDEQKKGNNNNNDDSSRIWLKKAYMHSKKKRKSRLKRNKLCKISEEILDETDNKSFKQIVSIKDLDKITKELIPYNSINACINACNACIKSGFIESDLYGLIILSEVPILGEKLRDIFFKILILKQKSYINRRNIWIKLNFDAKLLLTPMGTINKFRQLFNIHKTVTISELLSVCDLKSFKLLEKPEWTRIVVFKQYLRTKNAENKIRIKMKNKAQSLSLGIPIISGQLLSKEFKQRNNTNNNYINETFDFEYEYNNNINNNDYDYKTIISMYYLKLRNKAPSCGSDSSKSQTFVMNDSLPIY